MMIRFTVLSALFVLFNSTTHAQTAADTAATQLRQLLTPGTHLLHYIRPDMTKGLTPEQKALQGKVVKAMMENAAWVRDSMATYSDPQAMMDAMRKKTGLTEEEWNEYQSIAKGSGMGYTTYGEDHLEIIVNGKQIGFHGTGASQALDSVVIDFTSNTVLYRRQQLPFTKISRSGADNPFHTPVIGYQYELDKSSTPDLNNPQTMHLERYDFAIARFTETGKLAITLIALVKNGVSDLSGTNIALLMVLD